MYKIYYQTHRDGGTAWKIQSWSETLRDATRVVKANTGHNYNSLVYDEDLKKWYRAYYDKQEDQITLRECDKPAETEGG